MLALVDLAKRYRDTIVYHWRNRQAEIGKQYSKCEAEFLPASLALIERPLSPTARFTGLLLVLLVFIAIGWAVLSRVDIVVTATGKVIPSSRTKTIASVDVASVRAIFVVEGQSVRSGDVLVELNAGVFEADERKAEGDVSAARLEVARSNALIAAIDSRRPPTLTPLVGIAPERYAEAKSHLVGQYLDYQAKLAQLVGEIARYTQALPLAQERARIYEDLANTHDVSVNAWSEKKQAAIDLEGQLTQAQNARLSLVAETRRQALDSLSEAEKIVTSATQDAARAMSHAQLLTLRAPVDGSVQQLTVHTIGGVVPAAQPLMLIVPKEDKVEVEGYVENRDIGFVSEGQSAQVKVDAFDYTKHGMIHGLVDSISRDAVDDEKRGPIFKTNVSLDRMSIDVDGHQMLLTPGMTVQIEIKTGTRRVIEYVLSPLVRHRHESLNER
jgi:membrane fusion protein, hemolysin D